MKASEEESGHAKLVVWQKSMDLVTLIYQVSTTFPNEEKFGLTSQMRRAAVSIPSNIAEGRSRGSRKDFAQFLHIALGSAGELETQLLLAKRLFGIKEGRYTECVGLLQEVRRMIIAMIRGLKTSSF